MNCIAVIACLGLLFGTLLESGADFSDVTSEVVPVSSNSTNANLTGVDSAVEPTQSKVIPSSPAIRVDSSSLESVTISHTGSEPNNGTTNPNSTDITTEHPPSSTSTSTPTPKPQTTTTTILPPTTAAPTTAPPTPTTPPVPTSPPTPNTTVSTLPPIITTKASLTTETPATAKPSNDRRFDGPSFIGGIVFALGVTAIAFVAWKFYKARTERNYHTL